MTICAKAIFRSCKLLDKICLLYTSSVPILAVTADAFDEDRQRALEAGMNGHLPKPIEVDKLFGVLDTLLD